MFTIGAAHHCLNYEDIFSTYSSIYWPIISLNFYNKVNIIQPLNYTRATAFYLVPFIYAYCDTYKYFMR